jgi:kynurenine formamidase
MEQEHLLSSFMKHVYLSYPITSKIPVYGGIADIKRNQVKSISSGSSANVYSVTMQNHWGTHIDAPNHFFENGLMVNDYPPDFWFFKNPMVIHIDLKQGELLCCSNWIESMKHGTDIILFKSGWGKLRKTEKYGIDNPGIHPQVGFFLREEYPSVRAVGIDWVSISSFENREAGRQAHHAFLDPDGVNNPVLIIEDMDLSHDLKELMEVWVAPLRVEGVDSAPCTVMGLIND